ncbi:MAG: CsbD family protein [Lentimicrobium sp.]|nr:CsbD family protein [Lentimicrobium sp.]
MNTTGEKGSWNEKKGELKQKLDCLSGNDPLFEEGKNDEMLGKLEIKLGKTKEELIEIISTL